MKNMKKYQVYYRRQGYPYANIYCVVIEAYDEEMALQEAYFEISDDNTIVSILEEDWH